MDIIVSDEEKYPDFSFQSILASEGIALKTRAGIPNRAALQAGIDADDPEAWQALVWLLRKRAAEAKGEQAPRLSETDFEWGSCRVQFTNEESAIIEAYVRAQVRRQHIAGNHKDCGPDHNTPEQDTPEQEVQPLETPTEANPST